MRRIQLLYELVHRQRNPKPQLYAAIHSYSTSNKQQNHRQTWSKTRVSSKSQSAKAIKLIFRMLELKNKNNLILL